MGGGKVRIRRAEGGSEGARRGRRKDGGRGGAKGRTPSSPDVLERLGDRPGTAAVFAVGEQQGGNRDIAHAEVVIREPDGASRRGSGGGATRLFGSTKRAERLAAALAAVGHPHRLAILVKLLDGPAVYQSLRRTTGLKAGPLYHHINQLRLAGLILPKQRDVYELTRGGRNLILGVAALSKTISDGRRRPI